MLKPYKDRFTFKYGVERLGDSVVRGEQDNESDIDIVIKMQRPNLLRHICIREELEDMFQRKVLVFVKMWKPMQSISDMGLLEHLWFLTMKAEQAVERTEDIKEFHQFLVFPEAMDLFDATTLRIQVVGEMLK